MLTPVMMYGVRPAQLARLVDKGPQLVGAVITAHSDVNTADLVVVAELVQLVHADTKLLSRFLPGD